MVTFRCGPSWPRRPASFSGDPIMKLPAGTTTISGQLAHSLRIAGRQCLLGLRAQHGGCDIPELWHHVIDHPSEHGQQREKDDTGKTDERSPPQSLASQGLAT